MARKKGNIKYTLKGYKNMNNNFIQVPKDILILTTVYEYKVYSYLCDRHNFDLNYAFPSLTTIAKNTNISLSSVQRAIKGLEEMGLIEILKNNKGEYNNNSYRIYVPTIIKNEIREQEEAKELEESNKKVEGKIFEKEIEGYFDEEE